MQAQATGVSPSAAKPARALASWRELGVPIDIIDPTPATREELYRAHDASYVNAILECRAVNGFGTKAADLAASLPYTVGAMTSAAREAIRNGSVAVAPVSGFHHAHFAHPEGFCTFNGLMVAALALKAEGLARRVGILDLDQHYGNGTADIIERLGIDWIEHFTAGSEYFLESQAEKFLRRLPEHVASMKSCDVILYQAGADPHIEDPLGGWLSSEQLAQRDRLVFEAARALGIPIAWNLAGGYQTPLRKVLLVHDNTMSAAVSIYLA